MDNDNVDSEKNQEDKYMTELDEEFIETDADIQRKKQIGFLKGNAFTPFKLFDMATWEIKTRTELYQGTNQRIVGSSYLDSIILYGFLQYVRQWHERDGRIEDGTIYCTRTYICSGLHWSEKRYSKAMKILEENKFIQRKHFPIRDVKTNQVKGSYVRLQLFENN